MARHAALPLDFGYSVLEIVLLVVLHVHSRDKDWRVREQVIHLLERTLSGLGLDGPEEESVGEVADDLYKVSKGKIHKQNQTHEEDIEPPTNFGYSNRRYLADHSVEGEAAHRRN